MTGSQRRIKGAVALYGKGRRAWVSLLKLDIVLRINPRKAETAMDDPYEHDEVMLDFATHPRKFFIPLTSFTVEELDTFQKIVNLACDAARPVCESLDRVAQAEADAGADELAPRSFRQSPALIIRDLSANIATGRPDHPTPDNRSNNANAERDAYADEGPPTTAR